MRASGAHIAHASSWPDADALFRGDPRWRGSDDAYSIELSPGRRLWLFGDAFVEAANRRDAAFIRNCVGIQDGADPATATMTFTWNDGAFFLAPNNTWYWPLHGALTGDTLILFMMRVRSPGGGTGAIDDWRRMGPLGFFEVFGWSAIEVANPHDDPASWTVGIVAEHEDSIVLGASVLVDGDWLLAYGWDPDKRVTLARWPLEAVARTAPEWWTGWAWKRAATPAVVIEHGATEFSVHYEPASEMLCQVQMSTMDQALAVRWSARPEGPWSEQQIVFRPEESAHPGVFVYAGKAHPGVSGADIIATYASNADVDTCLDDESIYYPRFVRLNLEAP